ncbi:hypothetical protein WR25_15041 [Diploscapter pachys]|uniref:Uncharacterized protein n=1 Tax=Diploscapter pachys TaxID=2018661 RepID=A0A2A2KJK8_9BILA|nr:hypothetical protein WR25_15041 [Diploscapter pachys]
MTERYGPDRVQRIAVFLDMVVAENDLQNLIAPSTIETIWVRHALDSAQLMFHVEQSAESWLDIGTGGGFPGMVVALLFDGKVTMVEPRKKRAAFLQACVDHLGIANADVMASKVEAVSGRSAMRQTRHALDPASRSDRAGAAYRAPPPARSSVSRGT